MRTAVVCALLCAAALPGPSAAYAAQSSPTARHAPQAPPAGDAPQAPPAVSVTVAVTDGRDDAEAGRRLDYRITVHNLGATTVRGARIEQEMPATTVSATAPGATVEGRGEREQKAIWRADLPAHDIQVFTASAVLGNRPRDTGSAAPGTLRAASTVCVYVGGSYAPTACSGDLDDLPETHAETASGGGWVGWAVAAAVTALFGPGVVRAVRRRRAARPR
ncbi:YajG family lipoprotein [Streptomyces angustmyceticus]|uniref:hypothetical protein n=1 Tax=Streptomyces angustmyceticus TaxID=285578 RepID=UPI00382AAA7C